MSAGIATSVDAANTPAFLSRLLAAPMSAFQLRAVAIIVILCALDGFDVFAITFAAPAIEREMGIGKGQLGIVFSAGLIGMAIGSFLLSPLADTYGRRTMVIFSLLLMMIGTLWTALAPDLSGLALSRFGTGLGIGAMIAVINPLAAEYANGRRRDMTVTLLNVGFPVGGVIGGLLAAQLLPVYGWRSIFYGASALALVMLAVVLAFLPEPVPGILARGKPDALKRVNAYLAHCGQPALSELPPAPPKRRAGSVAAVLGSGDRANTLTIASIYFLYVMSVFYIQSWIPSIIGSAGYAPSQAAIVSVWMNITGVIGGLIFASAALRFGLKPMVITAFTCTAAAIVLFGIVPPRLGVLTAVAAFVGFSTIGGMAVLYAVVSRSFPGATRATGTGFVVGLGRVGSAIGPSVAGLLFSLGFERALVSVAMAAPAILAAFILARKRLGAHA